MEPQIAELRDYDILIATPGRFDLLSERGRKFQCSRCCLALRDVYSMPRRKQKVSR
jgi:superfamily II DNA/RNA helicase